MAYSAIPKSTSYFNTKLYTGNATDDTAITGVGFQPDWLWGKNRTDATNHYLIDAVRGVTKEINSNNSDAQGTDATLIKSFDSDGFTLGDGSLNQSAKNFVAWNWKANGTGSANTDGSISSTVSVNTTSGFSIVKWTGTSTNGTIGHGLGVVPKMIIVKRISGGTGFWIVYHSALGNNSEIYLNATNASFSSSSAWQNTDPTSSVFYVSGAGNDVNGSGDYIAYCFAEKTGFSKFGSYVGNGNVNGAFIYTGFKPKFLMTKYAFTGGTGGWLMYNGGLNTVNKDQFFHTEANTSAAWVDNTDRVDFLSNGFKFRDSTNSDSNTNGGTYIYMAYAEAPLVGSNNVPATAR
jgi:hypothetical protein